MNAKEYLSQARNLDQRIITKNQMIDSLNDLATRCTATIRICLRAQTVVTPVWRNVS